VNIPQTCPICSSHGSVRSLGAFGWVCVCSQCYEPDDEADRWRRLQGHGETMEDAVDAWLEDARELATVDEIPPLRCAYVPRAPRLIEQVVEQAREEFARQHDFELVEGWRRAWDDNEEGHVHQEIIYLEFPCSCQ
jgi:hypothetical protein